MTDERHKVDRPEVEWAEALLVSELPHIDEALRNFLADPTEDNAVCLVRDILQFGRNHD